MRIKEIPERTPGNSTDRPFDNLSGFHSQSQQDRTLIITCAEIVETSVTSIELLLLSFQKIIY